MADVETRLALLGTALDAGAPTVDVAEIQQRASDAVFVREPVSPSIRPAWVMLAAAVVTFVIVGGAVLVAGGGSRLAAEPPSPAKPGAWVLGESDPRLESIRSLTCGRDAVFAQGGSQLLVSTNGLDWEEVDTTSAFEGTTEGDRNRLTWSGSEFVVGKSGIVAIRASDDDRLTLAITSPNGIDWNSAVIADEFLTLWRVAVGPRGALVAAAGHDVDPVHFVSADLVTWTPDTAFPTRRTPFGNLTLVAATDNGYIGRTIIGFTPEPWWYSPDGFEWHPLIDSDGSQLFDPGFMEPIEVVGDYVSTPTLHRWFTSNDHGATWQAIDLGEPWTTADQITGDAAGYLAVSRVGKVWYSTDGIAWESNTIAGVFPDTEGIPQSVVASCVGEHSAVAIIKTSDSGTRPAVASPSNR